MSAIKAGFFMGIFCIGVGAIGVTFGLPIFMGYLLTLAGVMLFLSGLSLTG